MISRATNLLNQAYGHNYYWNKKDKRKICQSCEIIWLSLDSKFLSYYFHNFLYSMSISGWRYIYTEIFMAEINSK